MSYDPDTYGIPRGLRDLLRRSKEPETDFGAFCDLMENAFHKPGPFTLLRQTIQLTVGQWAGSISFFATRWNWTRCRVRRFFARLQADTLLKVHTDPGFMVITICNYLEIQARYRRPDTPSKGERDPRPTQVRPQSLKYESNYVGESTDVEARGGLGGGKPPRRVRHPATGYDPNSGHVDIEELIAQMPDKVISVVEVVAEPPVMDAPELTVVECTSRPVEDLPPPPPRAPPELSLVPVDDAKPAAIAAEMVAIWNEVCGRRTRKVQTISDERKKLLLRAFRKQAGGNMDHWRAICEKISTTPFLCGAGDRGWKVDIDWVCAKDHSNRILEGIYDGPGGSGQHEKNGLVAYALRRCGSLAGDADDHPVRW